MSSSPAILDTATADAPPADGRRWLLALMSLVSASQVADRQLLSIVMEPIKREYGFSDAQMGFLNGTVFGTAYALGALPLALLADRWSRRRVIALTLAFWSAMTALTAGAMSFAAMVVARALVGLGESGAGPAMLAWLSTRYPPAQRAGMVAVLSAVTSLGGFAAYWGAGVIVEQLGWRALFLVFGIPGLALAALVWFTTSETAPAPGVRRTVSLAELRRAMLHRPMLHLFAAAAWAALVSAGLAAWTPSYLVRSFQLGFAEVGFWAGLAGALTGIVGALLGGALTTKLNRDDPLGGMRLCIGALALNLPVALALYATPSLPLALALLLTSAVIVGSTGPAIAAQLLSLMPEQARATLMAVVSTGVLFVAGLGATLAGTLSDVFAARGHGNGLQMALLLLAALGFAPVLHLLAVVRAQRRRSAAAAP